PMPHPLWTRTTPRRSPRLAWRTSAAPSCSLSCAATSWCVRRRRRGGLVTAVAAGAVLFIGTLAAWGATALDAHKAPRALVRELESSRTEREVRVAAYRYFQPSLVFYCRREVYHFDEEEQVLEFLRWPVQVYLFLPEAVWRPLADKVPGPHRVVARQHDLYRNCDVVVVTNR